MRNNYITRIVIAFNDLLFDSVCANGKEMCTNICMEKQPMNETAYGDMDMMDKGLFMPIQVKNIYIKPCKICVVLCYIKISLIVLLFWTNAFRSFQYIISSASKW